MGNNPSTRFEPVSSPRVHPNWSDVGGDGKSNLGRGERRSAVWMSRASSQRVRLSATVLELGEDRREDDEKKEVVAKSRSVLSVMQFCLGLLMAFVIIYKMKGAWVQSQWSQLKGEDDLLGNVITKLVVVSFFVYLVAFWMWVNEILDSVMNLCVICLRWRARLPELFEVVIPSLSVVLGIAIWDNVWASYVLENPLGTCSRETFVGRSFFHGYQREYCLNGSVWDIINVYFPMQILTLVIQVGSFTQSRINEALGRRMESQKLKEKNSMRPQAAPCGSSKNDPEIGEDGKSPPPKKKVKIRRWV